MDFKNRFNEKYKISPGLFGGGPMPIVESALKYISGGDVLELGVGNGRNALYLLSKSFDVTGVDVSKEGLEVLRQEAGKNPKLHLVESDVLKFSSDKKYDLVLAIGLLHFLSLEDIKLLVKRIKEWTRPGGLNVIAVRMTQNLRNDLPHIFASNELKNFYLEDGWEIKEYSEEERGVGRKLASLIAQKNK